MSLITQYTFIIRWLHRKASLLIKKTFPFLKKLFFHKKTITTIRPSLLPTKKGSLERLPFFMEKGGPPPSSAASPLGLCRRAIPPQEHHQPCDDHTTENHRPRPQRHVHEDFRQRQQEFQIQGLRQHGRTCGVHPQWEHHAPVFRSVGRRVLFHAVPPEPEQKKHRDPEGRRGPRHERQPFDEREKPGQG